MRNARTQFLPALLLTLLLNPLACGDSVSPEPDPKPPTPPTARIEGSTSAYIDDQGSAPLVFTSTGSVGVPEPRRWWIESADGGTVDSGSGTEYRPRLNAVGSYTVHLEVTGLSGAKHDTAANVEIHPALPVGQRLPMLVYRITDVFTGLKEVHMYEPETNSLQLLWSGTDLGGRWDWAPDGGRLVATVYNASGASDLVVVDAETLAIDTLTQTANGVVHEGRWSPAGGVIAYTDDYRTPPNVRDELLLMVETAQGWEQRFPGGEAEVNPDFFALSPSWSPDGSAIAGAGRGTGSDRRVWIFSDLDREPASVRRLTRDSVLLAFFERRLGREIDPATAWWDEGSVDAGWSPDPEWVAFSIEYYLGNIGGRAILMGRIDGTDLRFVCDTYGSFAWSPDGNWIYLNPVSLFDSRWDGSAIYRVHSGGGVPEKVLDDTRIGNWY